MNDWTSYRLQDFIPFTADVYFRLLERMGETFWPLHLLTLALGAASIVLALKGHTRLACLLPAPLWAFVAVAFFSLTGLGLDTAPRRTSPPVVIGMAIALFGLIILPLMALLTGSSWYQAEVFGIHADPTAITTLGLALIMLRGFALWITAIIPALWLLISGLTLQVLNASGAGALFAILAMALLGLVWKSIESRPANTADN